MAFVDLAAHKCRHCQRIVLNFDNPFTYPRKDDDLPADPIHSLDFFLENLFLGSAAGCDFCHWLVESAGWSMSEELDTRYPYWEPRPETFWKIVTAEMRDMGTSMRDYTLCLMRHGLFSDNSKSAPPDHPLLIRYWFSFFHLGSGRKICSTGWVFQSSFSTWTEADNAAAECVLERPIDRQVWSSKDIIAAQSLLKQCDDEHSTRCTPSDTPRFTPTRLLEIRSDADATVVALVETAGTLTEPYAALSYCWGSFQPATTTTSSLVQRRHGTTVADLPNTLRDAVTVCCDLQLKYLWVDALCIIQDDPDDKLAEIATMPQIYLNAHLTISASRAADITTGFLYDRQPAHFNQRLFELPYRARDGTAGAITMMPRLLYAEEPLDKRGWALQEKLLSRRLLLFGSHETTYSCYGSWMKEEAQRSLSRSTCLHVEPELKARRLSLASYRDELSKVHDYLAWEGEVKDEDFTHPWYLLVGLFTRRAVTVPIDRTNAFAGIAEIYGRLLKDDYHAGFWRRSLPPYLMWMSVAPVRPRPGETLGPSWSWYSVSGQVSFEGVSNYRISAEIISIDAAPVSAAHPYGPVVGGRITLRAQLLPASLAVLGDGRIKVDPARDDDTAFVDALLAEATVLPESQKLPRVRVPVACDFAEIQGPGAGRDLFLVNITQYEVDTGWTHAGLVLEKLGSGDFSRVGYYIVMDVALEKDWGNTSGIFYGVEYETVCLV